MNIVPSLFHPLTSTHHHVASVGLELLQRCSTERLTDSTKTEPPHRVTSRIPSLPLTLSPDSGVKRVHPPPPLPLPALNSAALNFCSTAVCSWKSRFSVLIHGDAPRSDCTSM